MDLQTAEKAHKLFSKIEKIEKQIKSVRSYDEIRIEGRKLDCIHSYTILELNDEQKIDLDKLLISWANGYRKSLESLK